jgi:hypothetical protein
MEYQDKTHEIPFSRPIPKGISWSDVISISYKEL